MTENRAKILGSRDLEIDNDYEECVISGCGRPATQWLPSHVDGKLMPACDKHYHDSSITPMRWENARKRREALIKEFMGKKCYICGKPAIAFAYANLKSDLEKYGNNLPNDYVPEYVWTCDDIHHNPNW